MTPFTVSTTDSSATRCGKIAGSAIVLVLVTVLLAAFLLTKFVQRTGTELLADARAGGQARLRREAYSALELTLATMADIRAIDNGLFSPLQGWSQPFDYADILPNEGLNVAISFEDESGKISLPRADAATLESLFEQLGVDRTQAEQCSDALLGWTQAGHVPVILDAAGVYERSEIPHHAALRPLRTFAELAAIKYVGELFFDEQGRPNALAEGFRANVSLYSFNRINLNSASTVVLAVNGIGPDQAAALHDYIRQEGNAGGAGYFKAVSEATAILGANAPLQAFGTSIQALRINVTVSEGGAIFRLSALVAPPQGASLAAAPPPDTPTAPATAETFVPPIKKLDYPFKVLEIREDTESPPPLPDSIAQND